MQCSTLSYGVWDVFCSERYIWLLVASWRQSERQTHLRLNLEMQVTIQRIVMPGFYNLFKFRYRKYLQ